ncbi:MAG: HNH endonuclease [Propionibacteriales bacterium]|nr:HNH endonuclease [Propionibacteriales bacterium]
MGEEGNYSARSLREHGFIWETPFGTKESEIALSNQGGKWRLRITAASGVPHIHRQGATLALLPRPVRDESRVSHGKPIVLEDRYLLDIQVGLLKVEDGMATVTPAIYTGRSGTAADLDHLVNLQAPDRFARLERLWASMDALPDRVAETVDVHRQYVVGPDLIGLPAERSVRAVVDALEAEDVPWYIPGSDPLDALELLAGITTVIPDLPLPNEAPPDSPEIRRRLEVALRITKSRGKGHANFKKDVQRAYNFTCAFCGFKALNVPGFGRFGNDAAHILPWSQYDLDHVTNGLQLCRPHHWAFDNKILLLRADSGVYRVELNTNLTDGITDQATMGLLLEAVGVIPDERLPKPSERPSPEFIEKLYEGLEGY